MLGVLVVLIVFFMIKDNFTKAVRPRKDVLKVLLLPLSYALTIFILYITK